MKLSEDERAAFERSMARLGLVDMWLEKDDAGNYTFSRTADAWLGWQHRAESDPVREAFVRNALEIQRMRERPPYMSGYLEGYRDGRDVSAVRRAREDALHVFKDADRTTKDAIEYMASLLTTPQR